MKTAILILALGICAVSAGSTPNPGQSLNKQPVEQDAYAKQSEKGSGEKQQIRQLYEQQVYQQPTNQQVLLNGQQQQQHTKEQQYYAQQQRLHSQPRHSQPQAEKPCTKLTPRFFDVFSDPEAIGSQILLYVGQTIQSTLLALAIIFTGIFVYDFITGKYSRTITVTSEGRADTPESSVDLYEVADRVYRALEKFQDKFQLFQDQAI
ncbi:uncharacterized protein LOC135201366 [Macrobrachium nipponense]|uniref:uncharacterized protein LOC135201366 n=1 Tax=Macrobrachium nipponense TaxID=159736 RepID=UPI0030C7BAB3